MTSTLYRDGHVRTPDHPAATALLVRGGAIAWTGDAGSAPDEADSVVDLAGALVTPAFVDAHVHATSTGLMLTGLDLTGATSLADCLRQVEAAGRSARGGVVLGHGWDETTWPEHRAPTRQELDRASYGGVVYLSRVDVHSAVVSSAMLAAAPEARGEDGWTESGHLTRTAHHVVRRIARDSITPGQRLALQRATRAHAAALGIALLHELSGPDIAGAEDLRALLELTAAERGPDVVGYWGEAASLGGVARAQELGALGAAGDLFADGSIGSHTAELREPYADAEHRGHGYLDAATVRDHVVACTEARLQAGFHAIGDGAVDTVVAGLVEAAERVGVDRLRAARHRIEHVEMVAPDHLPVLARLGVVASVQPAFDRLWGGETGMYAERLGLPRALGLNPFAAMAAAGVVLALGSDSPVTPLDPWGGVRAAVGHRTPGSGLDPAAAFDAHTRGGWRAAGRDADGVVTAGAPATFAVWEVTDLEPATGLPALAADLAPPRCLRTVVRGATVHDVLA
jgi:predicted amidohydrolase YtcJ